MRAKWLFLLVAVFSIVALSGCGSGGDGGAEVVEGDGELNVETVGLANCLTCHDQDSIATSTWLRSTHGNSNGSMRYDDPRGPHDETSSCTPCHNQLLEGENLDELFTMEQIGVDEDGNPIFANVTRDIVVCESCHGGGSAHRGIGPIPYPRPDWEQCVACHDHPEGIRHADDFGLLASSIGASAHNNSDDLHASRTRCQRCHTAEGSVELAEYTGDADVMHLMDSLDPIAAEDELHPVTCATCHVPHNDSGRWEEFIVNENTLAIGNWDPNANNVPDQFDFCTSCHTYYNQDGTLIGSGLTQSGADPIFPGTNDTPVAWEVDTAPHYHNTSWYRVIPTTHFDNPLTGPQYLDRSGDLNENTLVEGYVMRQTIDGVQNESPCFDCHGHEFRTNTRHSRDEPEADDNPADFGSTIHTQWASSAHAANLLDQKYAAAEATPITLSRGDDGYEEQGQAQLDAVMAASASDDTSDGGWTHYNWDQTGRGSCQMCHTATGAANFMMDPANYNSADNDFSHLEGWSDNPAAGSPQNELLYCWGCHENAGTGALREPGAITLAYTNLAGVNPTMPDYGNSNVCINCHSGRGGMDRFLNGAAANPAGAAIDGGTRTHYYAAGATINQEITHVGYMYNTTAYADIDIYGQIGHQTLGCAECHMESDEGHTYMVFEKNDSDEIIEIKSNKCAECHNDEYVLTTAQLNHEAHGYHDALSALGAILTDAGTPPSPDYPYFSGSATDQGHGGAMHNHSYLHHEPGGYAHNRFYVKRLIFDSIDWLTDPDTGLVEAAGSRAIDGQIVLDTTYSAAIEWLGGDTITGIINSRP